MKIKMVNLDHIATNVLSEIVRFWIRSWNVMYSYYA